MRLNELEPGKSAIVLDILSKGLFKKRLLEMGLTPHTKVICQKGGTFQDPMKLMLRNYVLTIRKSDAQMVLIEEIKS